MLSLRRLPWMNLRGYPVRTGTLVLFSALMTMTIFGGTMLVQGIERGLATVQSRLGADIMVTPADADNDFDAQSFLVHAEASYFYMPTSTSEAVAAVDGVQSSSPQLFLASARASCCSGRYQVIAFDPGSDFTVQPWIADSVGQAQLGHMDVIVGANVSVYDTDNFALFGQRLHVVGKFDPTGSTLDNAVYTNFDTAKILIDSSLRKGLNKYTSLDTDDIISSVMVKVAPGRDVNAVAADIERSVPGVSVTTSTRMVSGIAQSLDATSRTVATLIAVVWGVGLLMITLIFVMMIIERKREFASLIVAGAHRGLVSRIILAESLTVNAIGGVVGIVISGVLIASFSGLVRQTIGTGFLVPPITTMALLALASLAAIAVVAVVASWISVRSIRAMDAGSLLKEGE
ncbi:ABC transporter permease [Schaalia odontolytica]|uniref:ABC transporter permease n=1 Tax=Schaalia odontolytica TaxID=1660 RepID=UPI00211B7CCC|nr:ABC transporter permease [Schaalia odontolytica]UUO93015.1 ABC transporter permease [Schaalia odontolytica]